jgi:tetratricopeptide (TPR) repeat protein
MAPNLNYFSVLGVAEDASQDEIEERYRQLAEYLSSAAIPEHLQDWARHEAALLDEAYAVLLDPEQRTGVAAAVAPRQTKARRVVDEEDDEEYDERPRATRRASTRERELPATRPGARRGFLAARPLIMGLGVGVLVVASLFIGARWLADDDAASPPATAGNEQTTQGDGVIPLDTARVAQLLKSLESDPNNTEAMFELGQRYFEAAQWQESIDMHTRLLAVDPNNIPARTDIGTANFNMGKFDVAKATWEEALTLAPNDVQLHYNMGFLYANAEPRDTEKAKQEWQKVIDLAPNSELAKIVEVHMTSLQ